MFSDVSAGLKDSFLYSEWSRPDCWPMEGPESHPASPQPAEQSPLNTSPTLEETDVVQRKSETDLGDCDHVSPPVSSEVEHPMEALRVEELSYHQLPPDEELEPTRVTQKPTDIDAVISMQETLERTDSLQQSSYRSQVTVSLASPVLSSSTEPTSSNLSPASQGTGSDSGTDMDSGADVWCQETQTEPRSGDLQQTPSDDTVHTRNPPGAQIVFRDPKRHQYPTMPVSSFEDEYYQKMNDGDYLNRFRFGTDWEEKAAKRESETWKVGAHSHVSKWDSGPKSKIQDSRPVVVVDEAKLHSEYDKLEMMFVEWQTLMNEHENIIDVGGVVPENRVRRFQKLQSEMVEQHQLVQSLYSPGAQKQTFKGQKSDNQRQKSPEPETATATKKIVKTIRNPSSAAVPDEKYFTQSDKEEKQAVQPEQKSPKPELPATQSIVKTTRNTSSAAPEEKWSNQSDKEEKQTDQPEKPFLKETEEVRRLSRTPAGGSDAGVYAPRPFIAPKNKSDSSVTTSWKRLDGAAGKRVLSDDRQEPPSGQFRARLIPDTGTAVDTSDGVRPSALFVQRSSPATKKAGTELPKQKPAPTVEKKSGTGNSAPPAPPPPPIVAEMSKVRLKPAQQRQLKAPSKSNDVRGDLMEAIRNFGGARSLN